ncbi:MAG: helix-turn-helix domain-containing protein [Acidobacteriota bacterium]|nr:helix-turn-helix domain-containing protein [Acidobacteriota bacterium]
MNANNSDQHLEEPARSRADNAISLGAQLRRAREERGLTLREMADRTRITRRYLEAIELDDYKQLPGGIFNRSFVKSFAREVGVNEQEALEAYAQMAREQGESPDEIPASRQQSRVYSNVDSSRSPLVTILLSLLILAVISLGIYLGLYYYQRRTQEASVPPANNNAPPNSITTTQNSPTASNNTAPANAPGLNVQVKAKGEKVWLRTRVDEEESTEITLAANEIEGFTANESLTLQYSKSKAKALEVTVNGRPAGSPTNIKGSSLVELVITKNDYAQ